MPYQIPEFIISNFLSRQTIALSISELPNDCLEDRVCPICHIPYSDPPAAYVHPDFPPDLPEYAVQVHFSDFCEHNFGRRCIEQHIRGENPWSHSCPTCRDEWFPIPDNSQVEIEIWENLDNVLERLSALDIPDQQTRAELDGVIMVLTNLRDLQP